MARPLFVQRVPISMFVINLVALVRVEQEAAETSELCTWLKLAHAVVADPDRMRPIIVGMARHGDVEEA